MARTQDANSIRGEGQPDSSHKNPVMNYVLWTVQILLALLFLFSGGTKLAMSAGELTKDTSLPAWFLRFIGVCELLGAIGLVLPSLLRIRPGLTPLAAAGLTIITIGATVITATTMSATMAMIPLVTAILSGLVAYGRWKLAPLARNRGST